ncbi:MAG TPA: amidohydrolase family protein [Pirellulaceae bacterium]|nr:amidohydrolase family protein [Pirellulaceae bacterium]
MTIPLSRRQVLQGAAAGSAAAAFRSVSAETSRRAPRIDTHLHCFAGKDDRRFPYHARAPYGPDKPATPEHLLDCMEKAGVDFAIVVHPEPYQDDHRYLEHCLSVGKGKLRGTLLLFADREGSLDKMPELCRKLDVVSVRVHAYAPDRLPPFGKPELRRLWTMATDHGLAVQLHFEPRYAPGFEPLIREFSKTRVIIDHLGRPFQGTPSEHAVVVRWARFENTVMKFSAIPDKTTYPHRDIAPVIRELTDAWGAERMIYGGGFSAEATGESYRQAFDRARSYLTHLSAADQDKILGGTGAKLFGFET